MKTSKLNGPALDWAVAKCEGRNPSHYKGVIRATAHPDFPNSPPMFGLELNYCTDWSQGGPIIEREKLQINPRFLSAGYAHPQGLWEWTAYVLGPNNVDGNFEQHGPTPLIAAMRAYVQSQLGDEIEIPEELV